MGCRCYDESLTVGTKSHHSWSVLCGSCGTVSVQQVGVSLINFLSASSLTSTHCAAVAYFSSFQLRLVCPPCIPSLVSCLFFCARSATSYGGSGALGPNSALSSSRNSMLMVFSSSVLSLLHTHCCDRLRWDIIGTNCFSPCCSLPCESALGCCESGSGCPEE